MVLGALSCSSAKVRETSLRLREIKKQHGLPADFEVKWTKISPAKADFYLSYVDYFLDDDDLAFRSLVINKTELDHARFAQDHDTWYYKMYFVLLRTLIDPNSEHKIYLDIKDTRGGEKLKKLHEVLSNNAYDFDRRIIKSIQQIRSNQVEQVQLADILTGAVAYANRGLSGNAGKLNVVERIRQRTRHSLTRSTLLREQKFNVFVWNAS